MASAECIDLERRIDNLSPCFLQFPYNPSGLLTDHGSFITHINYLSRLPEDKKRLYLASYIQQSRCGPLSKDIAKCSSPGTDSREQSQDVYQPALQAPVVEISTKSNDKCHTDQKHTSSFPVSSSSQPASTSQSDDSTHSFDAKQSFPQQHHTTAGFTASAQPSNAPHIPSQPVIFSQHGKFTPTYTFEHTPSSSVPLQPSPTQPSHKATPLNEPPKASNAPCSKRNISSIHPSTTQPTKRTKLGSPLPPTVAPHQPRPQVSCCAMQTSPLPSPSHQCTQTDAQPISHALHVACLVKAVQSKTLRESKEPKKGIGRLKQLLQQGQVHKWEGDAEVKRAGSWTAAALGHYLDSSFCYLEYCCLLPPSDLKQSLLFVDQTANLLRNIHSRTDTATLLAPIQAPNPLQALLLLLAMQLEVALRAHLLKASCGEYSRILEYIKRGSQHAAKAGPLPSPVSSAKPPPPTYQRPSPGDSSASTQDTMDIPTSQPPPPSSHPPSSRTGSTRPFNCTPSQISHATDSISKMLEIRTHAVSLSSNLMEVAQRWESQELRGALVCLQVLSLPGSSQGLKDILHQARQVKQSTESACQQLMDHCQSPPGSQPSGATALGGVEMMELVALGDLS